MSDDRIDCPGCDKSLKRTASGLYRKHGNGDCDFSGTVVQEEECALTQDPSATSSTAPSAESTKGDATESASPATPATPSSPPSPEPSDDASTSASASPAIPGVTSYVSTLADVQEKQAAEYKERVEAGLTPFSQPTPPDYERPTLFSQPLDWCPCMEAHGKIKCQGTCQPEPVSLPTSPPAPAMFSRAAGRHSEQETVPMTADGAQLAARLKELFYAYDNRRTSDNRSAQVTMGPSEMGTPCDRRLALSLMRMPPVNPGGDGWAAFVGTCIHAGLEQMFVWADAGTGRFAVEQRLEFPSKYVPKGTADLIDRTLFMLDDHKCQGRWSRNKLKTSGPIRTYRVQAHVYAHGARLRGEHIERVAIISWPRDESTLDDLYVWTEEYRPDIVKEAFERVERIAESIEANTADVERTAPGTEVEVKARVAANYSVADDCRFCPFYLPNARDITKGCNGKR